MSAAARKIMERYGWQKGQGLGRDKEGITTYVKVVRRDPHSATGLGHAADPAGKGSTASTHAVELDALYGQLKPSHKGHRRHDGCDTTSDSDAEAQPTPSKEKEATGSGKRGRVSAKASTSSSSRSSSESEADVSSVDERKVGPTDITQMSDQELFARCGGVRLGRAGRHRLFSGKLARIEGSHHPSSPKQQPTSSDSN